MHWIIRKFPQKLRQVWRQTAGSLKTLTERSLGQLSLRQTLVINSVLVTGLILTVRSLGGLQLFELFAFDQFMRLKPSNGVDSRILVVAISETDIQNQGQWPLSDQSLAEAIALLQRHHPTAIGLDLYRTVPHPPGHLPFREQLTAPNVVVIQGIDDMTSSALSRSLPVSRQQIGFNDFLVDIDGIVRRSFLYAFEGDEEFYSFALRLGLLYLTHQGISPKISPEYLQLGPAQFLPLSSNAGGYRHLDAAGLQVLINYRTHPNNVQQITFTDLLKNQFDPNLIAGKIVLIGSTAPSLKDLFATPYSMSNEVNSPQTAGVLLHAQMISQILSTVLDQQPQIWYWSEGTEKLWIAGWSILGGAIAWRLRGLLRFASGLGVALVSLCSLSGLIFLQGGWIPFVPAALALVVSGGTMILACLLYQTRHDALTGLPNRHLFLKQMLALPEHSSFAILFLDIDSFKLINDSLGHQQGDQLLIQIVKRIQPHLKPYTYLARVGGDQFAILLQHAQPLQLARDLGDTLRQAIEAPFTINEQPVFIKVSIGISEKPPDPSYPVDLLLRDAHTAMYQAKALGGSQSEIYTTGMHDQATKRLQTTTDLHLAIEQQAFQLYYQPILDLQTQKIQGFEALIRWLHPKLGFISPGEFIPVAEATGLIIPIGAWVLKEACQQLKQWQQQFPNQPALSMHVNLSNRQMLQEDLGTTIAEALQSAQLDGQYLNLEITESLAMQDVEYTIQLLQQMKALNLRLSIDDFGTGYSSFSYLRRFPIDSLKIDRSFVDQMETVRENAILVEAIVELSHRLGLTVVAEGVETEAQCDRLQQMQCNYGQGYLFSRPLNAEMATQLLTDTQGVPLKFGSQE